MSSVSRTADPTARRPSSRAARRAAIVWVLVALTASVLTALFAVSELWVAAMPIGIGATGLAVGAIHAIHRLAIVEHARRR